MDLEAWRPDKYGIPALYPAVRTRQRRPRRPPILTPEDRRRAISATEWKAIRQLQAQLGGLLPEQSYFRCPLCQGVSYADAAALAERNETG